MVLSFNDGTRRDQNTDDWGEALFDLTGVENKIAVADVSKEGFESKTKTVNVDDGVITIDLKETGEKKGNDALRGDFVVNVGGANAEGVVVSLIDTYTQTPIATARVDSSNKALFPQLNFNTLFAITAFDPDGRFVNYQGQEIKFERNLQEETITLDRKSAEDELVVTVKGKDGERLAGAEVKLYDKITRTWHAEGSTDSSGNVRFTVSGRTYYATAFKEGYLPGFAENARRGDAKTIELEKEGAGNSAEASVVVKENGAPLPDVEVNFFKANGFPLGIPSVFTSADGSAVFNIPLVLDGKNYKAYAIASVGSKAGRSDLVDVADGIDFIIAIQAPPANVTLIAKNLLTNERIPNALFSVITPGDSIIKDCASPCAVSLPAQVEFRIVASASNYMQTTTAPISFEPGESKTVEVLMYPLSISKKNSLNFIGFFDRNGNSVVELQRAEAYTAKFMLSLGEKSNAFVFFQAGESADIASEPFELKEFRSALRPKTVFAGETPENICSPEEKTQPEVLKWIELDYTNQLGASEIILEFTVKDNAPAKSEAKILYRAGGTIGTNGIPFTSPQDDDLITQLLSQSTKDRAVFCNAKTNVAMAKVESSPLTCKEGLCSRIILEREDGFKSSNNLAVPIGQQFKMNFDLFAPGESIDSVALEESPFFEIISGNAGEAHFAERTFAATGTEKTSGSITMRALRQTARSILKFKVSFASEKTPIAVEKSAEITGSNSFEISASPKQALLGETVRAETIVLDSLSRPVTDAEVSLLNCEDSRNAIAETKTVTGSNSPGAGRDGKYEFRFTPQTIGALCVEARASGFETKTIEAISVSAEDFLTLDKEKISFTGAANQQTPMPVEVKIGLKQTKVKIQAGVNAECLSLLSVIPAVKENAEESAQFNIRLNSFDVVDADCIITFQGEANPTTKATVLLPVSIHTTAGPPPEALRCEPSSCLTPSEAQSIGCSPRSGFVCEDAAKSCFVCGSGLDGIESISLSISNLKNDRRVYPLFLDFEPKFNEQFDLVWDQQINTRNGGGIPQQNYPQGGGMPYDSWMSQQYGVQPYYSPNYPLGIGQGYSQFQYPPDYQNPIRTGVPPQLLGSSYPYQQTGGYGYSQSQLAIPPQFMMQQGFGQPGGAYPGLQPNQPVVPPYCYNYVFNSQSAFNNQYSQIGFSGYTPGVPSGYPQQCQYPFVCQNPQACGYIAGGQQGFYGQLGVGGGGVPPQCQYPQVCNNPSACSMFGGFGGGQPQVQFRQTGQPFKLSIDLSKNQLVVSAVYSGDEYFFAGGQGASARGFLIIRDARGVEKKRIAITVQVGYSGGVPPQGGVGFPPTGIPPYGMPPRIPPECFALFYPPSTTGAFGLPQSMAVFANAYTGKGQAEYSFDAPRSGKILCISATSLSYVSCAISERKETVEIAQGTKLVKKDVTKPVVVLTAKESKARKTDAEAQGKAKFTWSLQPSQIIEQDFAVKRDEFTVQKITLFVFPKQLYAKDTTDYPTETALSKEKCDYAGSTTITISCGEQGIHAEASGTPSSGTLKLQGLGDYQVRMIPVSSSSVGGTFILNLNGQTGKASGKITFKPKLTDYDAQGEFAPQVSVEDWGAAKCPELDPCLSAELKGGEIILTSDYSGKMQDKTGGGKTLPAVSDRFWVKLKLPKYAEREISIPVLVTNQNADLGTLAKLLKAEQVQNPQQTPNAPINDGVLKTGKKTAIVRLNSNNQRAYINFTTTLPPAYEGMKGECKAVADCLHAGRVAFSGFCADKNPQVQACFDSIRPTDAKTKKQSNLVVFMGRFSSAGGLKYFTESSSFKASEVASNSMARAFVIYNQEAISSNAFTLTAKYKDAKGNVVETEKIEFSMQDRESKDTFQYLPKGNEFVRYYGSAGLVSGGKWSDNGKAAAGIYTVEFEVSAGGNVVASYKYPAQLKITSG